VGGFFEGFDRLSFIREEVGVCLQHWALSSSLVLVQLELCMEAGGARVGIESVKFIILFLGGILLGKSLDIALVEVFLLGFILDKGSFGIDLVLMGLLVLHSHLVGEPGLRRNGRVHVVPCPRPHFFALRLLLH